MNLSARVGSISDNRLGGWYSYRMSKSALNQATRTLSIELKRQGTRVHALHPGTCETGLSQPFQRNVKPEKLFSKEYAVSMMLDVVDHHMTMENTGAFLAYDGSTIEY